MDAAVVFYRWLLARLRRQWAVERRSLRSSLSQAVGLHDRHVAEQVVFGRPTVVVSPPAAWSPSQALRAAAGLRHLADEQRRQLERELAETRPPKRPPRPRSKPPAREPRTREHAIMQQAAQSLRALEERGARAYLRAEQREWLPGRPPPPLPPRSS